MFDVTTGQELLKIAASDAAEGDVFGRAVGISGTAAIVGAPSKNVHSGVAYLFSTVPVSTIDFNRDGQVNFADLDVLVAEIHAPTERIEFDLSGDGLVDRADLTQWLSKAATHNGFSEAFLLGDSNLDGLVDSTDLNNLALNWRQNVTQ